MSEPFCARCSEHFPVAKEPTAWRMGQLRLLTKAPKKMRQKVGRDWENSEIHGKGYLCGNCYFDFLDEFDDEAGR